MARLTVAQKAERCLRLILGLRHPQIVEVLAPYGFTPATLQEGWALMGALMVPRAAMPPEPPGERAIVSRLDEFENTWFPIARTALRHEFPDVAHRLFSNLSQQRGQEVVLSVGVFLNRLADMEKSKRPFEADGPAARQLLQRRGLTSERAAEAKALITQLASVRPAPSPTLEEAAEEERAAVEAMWTWYLAWSTTARVAHQEQDAPPRARLRAARRAPACASRDPEDRCQAGCA